MTTYYISPTGNDSTGVGTAVSPWATMSKAYSSSTTGDTILCDSAHGTFTWVTTQFVTARTVSNYGGGIPVFDGANGNVSWYGPITVSNIKFQNAERSDNSIGILGANASTDVSSFTNCIFSNLISARFNNIFDPYNKAWTITVTGCLFYNCSYDPGQSQPQGGGYFGTRSGGGVLTATITGNTFYSNNAYAPTIGGNNGSGVSLALTNNIFANFGATSSLSPTPTSIPTITGSNNLVYGYSSIPSALSSQTGYLNADPLFVDATNGNLNLRPTSPCIDAGTII